MTEVDIILTDKIQSGVKSNAKSEPPGAKIEVSLPLRKFLIKTKKLFLGHWKFQLNSSISDHGKERQEFYLSTSHQRL